MKNIICGLMLFTIGAHAMEQGFEVVETQPVPYWKTMLSSQEGRNMLLRFRALEKLRDEEREKDGKRTIGASIVYAPSATRFTCTCPAFLTAFNSWHGARREIILLARAVADIEFVLSRSKGRSFEGVTINSQLEQTHSSDIELLRSVVRADRSLALITDKNGATPVAILQKSNEYWKKANFHAPSGYTHLMSELFLSEFAEDCDTDFVSVPALEESQSTSLAQSRDTSGQSGELP